jgi:hypothetical protein
MTWLQQVCCYGGLHHCISLLAAVPLQSPKIQHWPSDVRMQHAAADGVAAPRRLGTGGPWFCVLPRSAWPSDTDKVAAIERDMEGEAGDRRQELVLIGEGGAAGLGRAVHQVWCMCCSVL